MKFGRAPAISVRLRGFKGILKKEILVFVIEDYFLSDEFSAAYR